MSSTEMQPFAAKVTTVKTLLERMKPELNNALPKHLTADRMMRVALTSIIKTPELLNCTQASLASAVLQAAQLGLEPDGVLGHAYLVPYGTTATLIPGYKGLVSLARRSGQLSTIEARAVHAKDKFQYRFGLKPMLQHVPSTEAERGDLVFVYAVAHLKDGGYQFDVMARAEVDAVRKRSRAGNAGPWTTDYAEMAKKTVLRRLCKLLPMSVEFAAAVDLADRVDAGLDPEGVIDVSALPEAPEKPALDALADRLEAAATGAAA